MRRPPLAGWVPAVLLGLALGAPSAEARSCTVGDAACPTLKQALAEAQADGEASEIRLPAGEVASDGASYAGPERLDLLGAGSGETTIGGALRLDGPEVVLRGVTLRMSGSKGLEASGRVQGVRVTGTGGPEAVAVAALAGGPLVIDDLVVDVTELDAGLDARCSEIEARHVTLAGRGNVGARASCGDARLSLTSSIVAGGYGVSLQGGGATARHSNLAEAVMGGARAAEPVPGDPGFVSATDLRLGPASGLVDRGDPAPLVVDPAPYASEPLEDVAGDVRAADGDGDGRARRDVGAYERQAPPTPVPDGNVLADPDAELPGRDGWTLTGGWRTERYGDGPAFPTRRVAAAVGGGDAFFAGGGEGDATATQVVDIGGQSAVVDGGGARATLSGLLGGFRADADGAVARATFRGPSGVVLGGLELSGPDPAARSHATTLLPRSDAGPIPPLTRSIEVVLQATKGPGGSYTDGYFDNLGLVLELPGAPDQGAAPPGGVRGDPTPPRPFSGVLVLSGRATAARSTGRFQLLAGCASATVARCTGDLELAAVLVRKGPRVAVGKVRVSLAPGATRRLGVRLNLAARRYLRRHTMLRVRVRTRAVDGQGLRRSTTVPLVVRPKAPKRRSARR